MKKYILLLLLISNYSLAMQKWVKRGRFELRRCNEKKFVVLHDNKKQQSVHGIHAQCGKIFVGDVHYSGRYIAIKDGYKIRVKKKCSGEFYEMYNQSINQNIWVDSLYFNYQGLILVGRSGIKSNFVTYYYHRIPYSVLNRAD